MQQHYTPTTDHRLPAHADSLSDICNASAVFRSRIIYRATNKLWPCKCCVLPLVKPLISTRLSAGGCKWHRTFPDPWFSRCRRQSAARDPSKRLSLCSPGGYTYNPPSSLTASLRHRLTVLTAVTERRVVDRVLGRAGRVVNLHHCCPW